MTTSPYIGCLRDVMDPGQSLVDFNQVLYWTGPEFGVCKPEKAGAIPDGSGNPDDGSSAGPEDMDEDDEDEDDTSGEPDNDWDFEPEVEEPAPEVYGECKLPITPARDTEVTRQSGLRFGENLRGIWYIFAL